MPFLMPLRNTWGHVGPSEQGELLHYQCSAILTRPKDGNKRRVIVYLYYPPGHYVNDQVTRDRFDDRPFTLKFPQIEDPVDQILVTEDPMLFKTDVARAFRNFINRILALFRPNAHKKCIKLNEEFYKDIDWIPTFLPSSNGITFFHKQDIQHLESLYLDASHSRLGACLGQQSLQHSGILNTWFHSHHPASRDA